MSLQSLTYNSASTRYLLRGPESPGTDMLVAVLVNAGAGVEVVTPKLAYRIDPLKCGIQKLADDLKSHQGYSLEVEPHPTEVFTLGSTVAPARAFRRTFTVHGVGAAFSAVARAVDRHLTVTPAGVNRWNVTGRTAELVAWAAAVHGRPIAEVMKLHSITPAMVEAEDEPPMPVSVVSLPDRETVTQVVRDAAGEIREVIHTETDA